jgi:hypothetical protein
MSELTDEFSATVARYKADEGDVTLPMVVTKFSLLMRHKLGAIDEKRKAAQALFECGVGMITREMDKPANGRTIIPNNVSETAEKIFSLLATEEMKDYIPIRAPAMLADVSLTCLRKAEGLKDEDFVDSEGRIDRADMTNYKTKMSDMAATALEFADNYRSLIDSSASNIKTSRAITAAKTFVIKSPS